MAYAVIFRQILGSFSLYMIPSDGKKAFCPQKGTLFILSAFLRHFVFISL
jgi:hypothetical protein